MTSNVESVSLTHRDLDATPDDGNLYEVIDGVLYMTPFATTAHQRTVTQLGSLLNTHVRDHSLGEVFTSGLKVVLDEPSGVGPDVIFISNARLDGLQSDGYYGAPSLLVEVLSSKPILDTRVKMQKYARAGVPHYWIVDPVSKCLSAYRLEGSAYRSVTERSGGETFESELFPGLVIQLNDLWL